MIVIYTPAITPRINYTLDLIFNEILYIEYKLVSNIIDNALSKSIAINYSIENSKNSIQIIPSGLLSERGTRALDIKSGNWQEIPTIFANEGAEVPFDLFSAVFYLVTRYEEYFQFIPDEHGRFKVENSISFKRNFLNIPVVEIWCRQLAILLGIEHECKGIYPSNYRFKLSIDIDHAWVYKNKGLILTLLGLLKSAIHLDFYEFKTRIEVLTNQMQDPGDSYKYLENIRKKLDHRILYFIQIGKRGKYDKNIHPRNRIFRELIRQLDANNIVGIHPSYASNTSIRKLKGEINKLSQIIKRKVTHSRQHFLKMTLPETYQNLVHLNITEDYTMGYSSQTGFRVGISRPYFFYDLSKDEKTALRIVPFQVMDRTLLTHMQHSPEKAIEEMKYYTEIIKSVGGQFVCLWHNTSLSNWGEWEGWKIVFDKMIEINCRK